MPGRALGLAWFSIDEGSHKLDVAIGAPEKARPRQPLSLPIKIGGLAAGEEAEVTVAAVDLGILNLTRYKTPDPSGYFFGQRKLAVEIRDLYGMLIDGMGGVAGPLQIGGDNSGALEGNLPTQPPLALYSGVVKVGADGAASVSFDLPAFNGSLRVMAVAWSKSKVGAAEANVIVRDPVVVTATLPRFLDLGDRSQMHVDIDNVEGEAGDYRLDLDIHGPLTAEADALTPHGDARRASARLGHDADRRRRRRNRNPRPQDHRSWLHRDPAIPARRRGGRARRLPTARSILCRPAPARRLPTISSPTSFPAPDRSPSPLSPFGALDAPALLQALERYPYGCSEQTVSRAMPLLYANRLAALEHLAIDPDLDGRVKDAIEREMTRQSSSGAFGLWAADSDNDDLWLDAFVADFLTRARERGFAVPQQGFDIALDHLRNEAVNAADPSEGAGEPLAYALYVLARNGRPVIGDLRYLADAKLAVFRTPMARGAGRRGARHARRPRARRQGVRRGARRARRRAGRRLFAARLRLASARRRGRSRADRRGQSRPRRNRGRSDRARRRGGRSRARASAATPARRKTTGSRSPPKRSPNIRSLERVQRRRPAGQGRDLSQVERLRARAQADRRSPTPASDRQARDDDLRRAARSRAGGVSGL